MLDFWAWFVSRVVQLPKKEANKFEPISSTSCTLDDMGSTLNKKLVQWAEQNDILLRNFLGFPLKMKLSQLSPHLITDICNVFLDKVFLTPAFLVPSVSVQ